MLRASGTGLLDLTSAYLVWELLHHEHAGMNGLRFFCFILSVWRTSAAL